MASASPGLSPGLSAHRDRDNGESGELGGGEGEGGGHGGGPPAAQDAPLAQTYDSVLQRGMDTSRHSGVDREQAVGAIAVAAGGASAHTGLHRITPTTGSAVMLRARPGGTVSSGAQATWQTLAHDHFSYFGQRIYTSHTEMPRPNIVHYIPARLNLLETANANA